MTPWQREVEPPPSCSRCTQAITRLDDLYRCAQCHAAFHLVCIGEHFGWSVNENPHASDVEPSPDLGAALADVDRQIATWDAAGKQAADRGDWTMADRYRYLASGSAMTIEKVRAALHTETSVPRDETAWLIERGQPEGLDLPEWWSVTDRWGLTRAFGWTREAWQAVRYPSKKAAEKQIARFDLPNHPFHARAVEHGFLHTETSGEPK